MITFGQSIPEVKCLVDRIAKYDRLDGLYIGYPAIKSKLPDAEIFQWYGSAALPLCLPFHDKVKKKFFNRNPDRQLLAVPLCHVYHAVFEK